MPNSTFIIAEAGVNHNGSLDMALELIDVAAHARADAVKFQTFISDKVVTSRADKAAYQVTNTKTGGTQLDMIRKLELSQDDHQVLVQRCKARGIRFLSTAFDSQSLAFLSGLDMPCIKLPSGDITCGPLLLQAARLQRPMLLSTGMSTLTDIESALGVLAFGLTRQDEPTRQSDFEDAYASDEGLAALQRHVTILHCVTQYPAPARAVNLRAMDTIAGAFGLPVGYSDHTLGIEVALAAVARGATVIEKHFTLDCSLEGPDHAASLDPQELARLVSGIRTIEQALGSPTKRPAADEVANRPIARRSLVAARRIAKGETFTPDAFEYKRPGDGLSPMQFWDLLGRSASRDFDLDDQIQ
ncbi:N-acetylneuraminate synthase [Comamonadaceae bacterium G21597-S1]|nr:N-acetylneuraminate synthase [Comamonadaceae bacterium G21597-S1]